MAEVRILTENELRAAHGVGVLSDRDPPELGQVLAGSAPGRNDDRQVTVCDLTGTGAQDTAIAALALARATARGAGRSFST